MHKLRIDVPALPYKGPGPCPLQIFDLEVNKKIGRSCPIEIASPLLESSLLLYLFLTEGINIYGTLKSISRVYDVVWRLSAIYHDKWIAFAEDCQ
jgi:hypothetical protein